MRILYISDNDYYVGADGGYYATAALPLKYFNDSLPMLKELCFWGRLRSSSNVRNMVRMDNALIDRGVAITFDGPREQPSGPIHYISGTVRTFPSLRRRLGQADVLWAKMPSIFAELAWRFGRHVPFRMIQQVGDAGQSVAQVYPRLRLIGTHQDRMARRMAVEADLSTFVSKSLRDAFGNGAPNPMVFHQAAVTRAMIWNQRQGLHEPFRLLYVGRVSPEKGLMHLVEALAASPGVQLEVVGDGPLTELCRQRALELGASDRITWSGRLSWGESVFARMRAADVLVLPSLTEGLPQVIVEALCMGLPVIATSVGGIPEIIETGRNGLLVPPADGGALARAIATIRQPDKWKQMSVNALAAAIDNTVEAQWGRPLQQLRLWWESRDLKSGCNQEVTCGRA